MSGVGSFFGEGALLEGGGERNAFVRAVKSLQLFVLTKAHLEQVFEGFPAAEAAIKNPLDDRRAEREVAEQTRAEDEAEEGVPPVEDEEPDEDSEQESDSEPEQEQGWLWMQSTAVVGALGRKDWSQIAA